MGHTNASLELNSQYNNGAYSFKHICKSLGIDPSLINEKINNITVTNNITFNSKFIFTIPKINGTVIEKPYNTTLNDFIEDSNEGNEKSFKPEFNNTTWQTGSVILEIKTIHTKTIT
jgi:hypothetical protein